MYYSLANGMCPPIPLTLQCIPLFSNIDTIVDNRSAVHAYQADKALFCLRHSALSGWALNIGNCPQRPWERRGVLAAISLTHLPSSRTGSDIRALFAFNDKHGVGFFQTRCVCLSVGQCGNATPFAGEVTVCLLSIYAILETQSPVDVEEFVLLYMSL